MHFVPNRRKKTLQSNNSNFLSSTHSKEIQIPCQHNVENNMLESQSYPSTFCMKYKTQEIENEISIA